MEKDEDFQIMGTITDLIVQNLMDEKDNDLFIGAYLKSGFLSSAVDALFYARRKAGLTQEEVAEKLGKKQAAIARWEADTDGKMSLRQYVELALAYGMVPLDITFVPINSLRDYTIDNPEAPRTLDAYNAWLTKKSQSLPVEDSTPHNADYSVENRHVPLLREGRMDSQE